MVRLPMMRDDNFDGFVDTNEDDKFEVIGKKVEKMKVEYKKKETKPKKLVQKNLITKYLVSKVNDMVQEDCDKLEKRSEEENLILKFKQVTSPLEVKTMEGKSVMEDSVVDDKMTSRTSVKREEIFIVEQVTSPAKVKQVTSPERSNIPNKKLNMTENSDPHDDNNTTVIHKGKQKLVSDNEKYTDPPNKKLQVSRGLNSFNGGNSTKKTC